MARSPLPKSIVDLVVEPTRRNRQIDVQFLVFWNHTSIRW